MSNAMLTRGLGNTGIVASAVGLGTWAIGGWIWETMEALESLKAAGKIRSIGASNTSPEELAAYVATGGLDAVQEEYSLLKRDIEATLLPVCRKHGISTLSYSSLGLGLLTGRIGPEREFTGDDLRKDNPRFSVANRARVARFMTSIAPICEAHGASPAQVVIAWTLRQPGITFSLCGARNPDQARKNAKAGRVALSAGDLEAITASAASHLRDMDG